jgi:hypothetical protein
MSLLSSYSGIFLLKNFNKFAHQRTVVFCYNKKQLFFGYYPTPRNAFKDHPEALEGLFLKKDKQRCVDEV